MLNDIYTWIFQIVIAFFLYFGISLLYYLICKEYFFKESIGEIDNKYGFPIRCESFGGKSLIRTPNGEKKPSITIGFVGDIMPFETLSIIPSTNLLKFFNREKFDLIVGNLEGIITSPPKRPRTNAKRFNSNKIIPFLKSIADANQWVLCIGNNHSADYGIKPFNDMKDDLEVEGFNIIGHEEKSNYKISIKGFNINIVAGTMWSNYKKCFYASRFECARYHWLHDYFNILFPHWHFENESYMRTFRRKRSKNLIRYGAYRRSHEIKKLDKKEFPSIKKSWDFIFGHHSHVPQPIESFNSNGLNKLRKLIAFSGGNFTSGVKRKKHRSGLIAKIRLHKTSIKGKKIIVRKLKWSFTWNEDTKKTSNREVIIDDISNKKSYVVKHKN